MSKKQIKIFSAKDWGDYEMLDTGDGEKLERFGPYTFVRPFEDAVWPKTLSKKEWDTANGKFWSGNAGAKPGWTLDEDLRPKWHMTYRDVKFWSAPTPFRHLSFFPEQESHWNFITEKISNAGRPIKFLNLFGYTGVASLCALSAGASVTHVDASRQSLDLAKENEELSKLEGMRVIEDDVMKFLDREAKRGNKYDAVIMDPPKFGRGPKGETWKIEENLAGLLEKVRKVLSDDPLFVILTSYAVESSSLSLGHALESSMKGLGGGTEQGELCIIEKSTGREISLANTAVWHK